MKGQSAIEYLVTYGWAILVIALVAGALVTLGVFNSSSYFVSKLQPGACSVYRPYGPLTTAVLSLGGVCGGGLPSSVTGFNQSWIFVNDISALDPNTITVTAWVYDSGYKTTEEALVDKRDSSGGYELRLNSPSPGYVTFVVKNPAGTEFYSAASNSFTPGTWFFVAGTWNGVTQDLYVNGQLADSVNQGAMVISGSTKPLVFGESSTEFGTEPLPTGLDGYLSNVQIYNASLSPNSIRSLYGEGLAGSPERLQNLVGWWPLNDNINDYSGNGYDGTTANNIFYESSYSYTGA